MLILLWKVSFFPAPHETPLQLPGRNRWFSPLRWWLERRLKVISRKTSLRPELAKKSENSLHCRYIVFVDQVYQWKLQVPAFLLFSVACVVFAFHFSGNRLSKSSRRDQENIFQDFSSWRFLNDPKGNIRRFYAYISVRRKVWSSMFITYTCLQTYVSRDDTWRQPGTGNKCERWCLFFFCGCCGPENDYEPHIT